MSLFKDFEAFYEEHVGRVRSAIFRMCGPSALEDLTQEVFIRAWKARDTQLDTAKPSTWMYKVATNVAIDYLRKNKNALTPFDESYMDDGAVPSAISREEALSLKQVLQNLDMDHRSVVVLHYFEDLEVSEIAKILNLPEGTIKSRLFNARKKLENALTKGSDYAKH